MTDPLATMIEPEDFIEAEWLDWYRKTPAERLSATGAIWANYRALGGSLAPDADSQSPFWSREELAAFAAEAAAAPARALAPTRND
jgi:hypothetical protein